MLNVKYKIKFVVYVELKFLSDYKKFYIYLWIDINEIKIFILEYMFNY